MRGREWASGPGHETRPVADGWHPNLVHVWCSCGWRSATHDAYMPTTTTVLLLTAREHVDDQQAGE